MNLTERSVNAFVTHDFENAAENKLSLGVFRKNGELYLKEVSLHKRINKWRWKENTKWTALKLFLEQQIHEENANRNIWLDQSNLLLKRQYAVLSKQNTNFRNPLMEKIVVKIKIPFVDANSTVDTPNFKWRKIFEAKFDELTDVETIAARVRRHMLQITTSSYDNNSILKRRVCVLDTHSCALYFTLQSAVGTFADFMRVQNLPHTLLFRYQGFDRRLLEMEMSREGDEQGYRSGYALGKNGGLHPIQPDISKENADRIAFGLDCYYSAYEKSFFKGYRKGHKIYEKAASRPVLEKKRKSPTNNPYSNQQNPYHDYGLDSFWAIQTATMISTGLI